MPSILQFGSGRFLRAFVDLAAEELNAGAGPVGGVVVVQSTGGQRAAAFGPDGYTVAIRGRQDGGVVDRQVRVRSVVRAYAANEQWPAVLAAAGAASLRWIVSNASEAGLVLVDETAAAVPRSFPAKLMAALAARCRSGLAPPTILPCELVPENGRRVRELVLEQAARSGLPAHERDWIASACRWKNTLVDRIVSAPPAGDRLAADPLAAVAEPFAYWGIEGADGLGPWPAHPAVEVVEDLGPVALRKVRILNAAHTALAARALPLGFGTVREAVADAAVAAWLARLLFEEIVPTLEGRTADPAGFARTTLERFANPFLDHRLADIAAGHAAKLQSRIAPTAQEHRRRFGRPARLLEETLAAAIGSPSAGSLAAGSSAAGA